MSAPSASSIRSPQPGDWHLAQFGQAVLAFVLAIAWIASIGAAYAQTSASGFDQARQDIPVIELRAGEFMIMPARGEAGFLLDYQRNLTAHDLLGRLDQFTTVTTPNLGYDAIESGRPNIWFHFRVRNAANVPGEWVVNFNRPKGTIEVKAYYLKADGSAASLFRCLPGECTAVSGSPFISGLLQLGAGETTDVLIWQPHRFSSQSPVTFATPQTFALDLAARDNRIWAMNGIWIAIVAVALLMGQVIGWRLALAYSAYSAAALLLFGLAEGTLPLIPERVVIPFAEDFLLQAGLIFLAMFIRQFFRLSKNFPRLDLASRAVIWLSIVNLVPIALGLGTWARVFTQVLIFSTHLIQSIAAIKAARAGWHGAKPVLIGAIVIFASAIMDVSNKVVPGLFQRSEVLEIGHAAFLAEALLFAVAILLMVLALQRERDRALREQLSTAEEKVRLDRELEASKARFEKARKDAENSRQEIEAIGHDLMQPLGALRQALSRRSSSSVSDREKLESALGLIESIARREGAESLSPTGIAGTEADQRDETFHIGLVIENIHRMFCDDAASKGTQIRIVPCSAKVRCDPVALMRIVSNLVSNALEHAQPDKILIGCRSRPGGFRLEVHDDGIGMLSRQLEKTLANGERAEAGAGQGMGLAIVQSLCASNGLDFSAHSASGKGTSFLITVPRA
ncbi:sensor histidine kinase [Altererythrobacter sp. MF3-039]|uniref:sensor histidine kinase n=1 Tax=Altererythrobacter sp. MF3-039 TaxID=3252901 RepID=UPI00390C59F7